MRGSWLGLNLGLNIGIGTKYYFTDRSSVNFEIKYARSSVGSKFILNNGPLVISDLQFSDILISMSYSF